MNQKLRGVISALRLDECLKKIADVFCQHFELGEKGTLMSDLHALRSSPQSSPEQQKTPERLDRDTGELLEAYERKSAEAIEPHLRTITGGMQTWQRGIRLGIKHRRFGRGRITFSSFKDIKQDSYVAVGEKVPDNWGAGRIREIFTYTHRGPTQELAGHAETYFVIERFKELSETDASHDPYRRHPFIAGRLFYAAFEDDLELVPLGRILCHVAYTPVKEASIKNQCIHALPLDRVCHVLRGFPHKELISRRQFRTRYKDYLPLKSRNLHVEICGPGRLVLIST
jgi:hypothetical protein